MSLDLSPEVSYYSAVLAKAFKEGNSDKFSRAHDIIAQRVTEKELSIIETECNKFTEHQSFSLDYKIKWLESKVQCPITPVELNSSTSTKMLGNKVPSKIDHINNDGDSLNSEASQSIKELERNIEKLRKQSMKMSGGQDTNNNVKKQKGVLTDLGTPLQTFSETQFKRKRNTNENLFASQYQPLKLKNSEPSIQARRGYVGETIINIGTNDESGAGEKLPSTSAFTSSIKNPSVIINRERLFQGSEWNDGIKQNSLDEGSHEEGETSDKKKKKKKKRKSKADGATADMHNEEHNSAKEIIEIEKSDGSNAKLSRGARRTKLKAVRKNKNDPTDEKVEPSSEPQTQVVVQTEQKRKRRTIKEFKRQKEEEERKKKEEGRFGVKDSMQLQGKFDDERTPLLNKPQENIKSYHSNEITEENGDIAPMKTTKNNKKKDKKKIKKKSSDKNSNGDKVNASSSKHDSTKTKVLEDQFLEYERDAAADIDEGALESPISFPFAKFSQAVRDTTREVPELRTQNHKKSSILKSHRKNPSNNFTPGTAYSEDAGEGRESFRSKNKLTSSKMDPWPSLNTGFKSCGEAGGKSSSELTSYASKVKTNLDSAGGSLASSSEDSSSSSSSSSLEKPNEEPINESTIIQNFAMADPSKSDSDNGDNDKNKKSKNSDAKNNDMASGDNLKSANNNASANSEKNSLLPNSSKQCTVKVPQSNDSNTNKATNNSATASPTPQSTPTDISETEELPDPLKEVFKNKWGLEFFDVGESKEFTEHIDENELLSRSNALYEESKHIHETQIIIGTVSVDDNSDVVSNDNMQDNDDCDANIDHNSDQDDTAQGIENDDDIAFEAVDLYDDEERQIDAAKFNYESSIKFILEEWNKAQINATMYNEAN